MKKNKTRKEHNLKILDLWQSANGNLFLKITPEYSIALGGLNRHERIGDSDSFPVIKTNPIFDVVKVGRLKIKKRKLKK